MSEKTINKLNIDKLTMPKKIYIGDLEAANENDSFTFSRNFKCKTKWTGEAFLRKVEIKTNDNKEFADYLTLIYAPTQRLLNNYKNKSVFENQKITNTEIITISKNINFKINDKSTNITLENEGLCGDILEIFNKTNKLEGLIINLYLGNNEFESIKDEIRNLL